MAQGEWETAKSGKRPLAERGPVRTREGEVPKKGKIMVKGTPRGGVWRGCCIPKQREKYLRGYRIYRENGRDRAPNNKSPRARN